jgi:hypothetical protein
MRSEEASHRDRIRSDSSSLGQFFKLRVEPYAFDHVFGGEVAVGDQIAQVLEEVECVSVSLGRSASTRAMRALSCSTSARISSRRVVHSPPRQAVRSRGLQARRRATRSGGAALLSCSCVQGCDAQLDRVPYTGSVDPEAEKSPLLCPECGVALGVPHRAATVLGEPGLIRLGLRCPDCWHAWEISVRPEDLPPPPPKTRS